MCRAGRLQVVFVVELLHVPPRKMRQETKRQENKDRKPQPKRDQSDPSPQGDPGVVSVGPSPDRSKPADQPTVNPKSQRCRREVVLGSRENKAAVEGRLGMAANPNPRSPSSTSCLLTTGLVPAWCGPAKPSHVWAYGEKRNGRRRSTTLANTMESRFHMYAFNMDAQYSLH